MAQKLLDGKVAVVTGGGQGIGQAISLLFAEHGARLAILDRDLDAGNVTVKAIEKRGGQAKAYRCNIVKEAEVVESMAAIAHDFGVIDVLVNNAGVLVRRAILDITEKEWELQFGVNVKGAYFCSREAAKRMVPRRQGAIVCISSIAGTIAMKDMGAYCASKAAVMHLARVLALELAPHGIRVNVVAPGTTDPAVEGMPYEPRSPQEVEALVKGSLEEFRTPVPLGRMLTTREQAQAVLFFASDLSSGATGQVLHVDGGQDIL